MGNYAIFDGFKVVGYADNLSEAFEIASPGQVIRYYEGCAGAWDWDNPDVVHGFFKEWKVYV